MLFQSMVPDVRDGFGSSSRSSDVRLPSHFRGKSQEAVHESHSQNMQNLVFEQSCWASLPLELLRDVISRLEASESPGLLASMWLPMLLFVGHGERRVKKLSKDLLDSVLVEVNEEDDVVVDQSPTGLLN